MKKILVMFFVVCALAFVYGCGGDEETTSSTPPAAQQTTTPPAQETPAPAADDTAAVDEDADTEEEAVEAAEDAAADAEDAVEAYDGADPFAGRAAITQADVDAYIKAIGKITAAAGDEQKILDVYKDAGWDEMTGAYVLSKVGTAYAISMAPAQAEMMTAQLPDSLKPTQAEIDLVTKNSDKITQAIMNAAMAQ